MHLMGSGTTARLVSAVRGLPSLSKSQQQFITAKEGYSPEISARVEIREKVPRVFHFRFISLGSFRKFAKKYRYQFSAITKSSAQIKNKAKYKYKWNKWSYFTHQLLAKTSPQSVRIARL